MVPRSNPHSWSFIERHSCDIPYTIANDGSFTAWARVVCCGELFSRLCCMVRVRFPYLLLIYSISFRSLRLNCMTFCSVMRRAKKRVCRFNVYCAVLLHFMPKQMSVFTLEICSLTPKQEVKSTYL